MAAPNLPPGFDFTDPDIYAHRLPVEEFAELRRVAPIWWNEQPPDVGGFGDGGYWVVSQATVTSREVSLRSDVFSSVQEVDRAPLQGDGRRRPGRGGQPVDDHDGRPRNTAGCARSSLAGSRHAPSRGCAPSSMSARRRIAAEAAAAGSGDFVLQVAGSCRCRRSPACSGCPWRTAANCSTGPTR